MDYCESTLKQKHHQEDEKNARRWWLTSVILATWEAEIRKIVVQGQPRQIEQRLPSAPLPAKLLTDSKYLGSHRRQGG
jgi:hypothetical protein